MYSLDKDAFSSGQIASKIWLCQELEKLSWESDQTLIYGGWYGLTAFLLLSRNNFNVKRIRSLDIDPSCEKIADMINELWIWQDWKFKAITQDCNLAHGLNYDLIINTSTEHFDSLAWWDNIPKGTRVVLQGNDMKHDDHVVYFKNIRAFKNAFKLKEINYEGQYLFEYPSWKFTRFMLIGKK